MFPTTLNADLTPVIGLIIAVAGGLHAFDFFIERSAKKGKPPTKATPPDEG